ncbi:hypothetical protein ACFQDD_02580 [Halorubrum pallidum]|uniref:MFS transporter n=1 Tax=Halorubrum pallidum TaxID=1526114 RepID=A0ABD5T0U8_9EURY
MAQTNPHTHAEPLPDHIVAARLTAIFLLNPLLQALIAVPALFLFAKQTGTLGPALAALGV